jgi:hypothetical protein
MAKTMSGVEVEPIDRLEEKVRRLVGVLDRLRTETARATEEKDRLQRDLDTARTRLSEAESRLADQDKRSAEVTSLIEEREIVRQRVADMLAQLEALNL